MNLTSALRNGMLVVIFGASLALGAGAMFASEIRERLVYLPREREVEEALSKIAQRERTLHDATGRFPGFTDRDILRDRALLALNWNAFPVQDYSFAAEPNGAGTLRLRALPRPDAVAALKVRARFYEAELSASGDMLHTGWVPAGE
jgi:hypothetical protein